MRLSFQSRDTKAVPASGSEGEILLPGRNCMDTFPVLHAGVLVDGRDYYLAFYRAALQAERHILISGWQFDTGVKLLRGRDAAAYGEEAPFLSFLNTLCARRPGLHIYILAWDYNVFFTGEREWFQERIVRTRSNGQLHFLLDARHAFGGSHHQKFAVIDNKVAFAGGADICADRWDDPDHLPANPLRVNPDGGQYGSYHEIQAYVTGCAVNALILLFRERWEKAGGGMPEIAEQTDTPLPPAEGIPLRARSVAFSRTLPRFFFPHEEPVEEILALHLDAISSARSHIYIENQYFSSRAIHDALAERMSRPGPKLEIVMILPKEQNAFREGISVGLAQSGILASLQETARLHGHALGIYYTAPVSDPGVRHPVYIHSKVLIVDDRFLCIGSANFTNRSQRIDTELNLSWEAGSGEEALKRSIRRVRIALLAEHAGVKGFGHIRRMEQPGRLVRYLDSLTGRNPVRLCRHPLLTGFENKLLISFIPTFAIDPEKQVFVEALYQAGRRAVRFLARALARVRGAFQRVPGADERD